MGVLKFADDAAPLVKKTEDSISDLNKLAKDTADAEKAPHSYVLRRYSAEEANAELAKRGFTNPPPYTPGTKVTEYIPVNSEVNLGRVVDSSGIIKERFATDLQYIIDTSIDQIKKDMNIPSYVVKNQKVEVVIPNGTVIRTGEVNGSPGMRQYDIVQFDIPEVRGTIKFNQLEE